MGTRSYQPCALLYACAGAFIGIFATLQVPAAGFPAFPPVAMPSFSLTSLAEGISFFEPDPAEWIENPNQPRAGVTIQTVKVRAGDTLGDVLVNAGVDRTMAFNVVDAVLKVYNLKKLQVGQELELTYDTLGAWGDTTPLSALNFEVDASHSVSVTRTEDGGFIAKDVIANTHRTMVRDEGVITSTLFEAAAAQNMPIDVLSSMVKLFSYDVDFQRDIQKGDTFALMYEQTVTEDGRPVRNLDIRYATMTLSGQTLKFYAYKQDDGSYDYYNEKGEGIRKALLRTPVNGARLTSNFGMRRHPILGYSLMHRGVDFGAATGTPIMAAGDGVIEKRERSSTYGNYVRIRHNGDYSTAYAHMSRFGADIAVGKRVRQGQVIGYVGATGRATGPHLHFEVLHRNKQVNPISVKFPAAQKLEGASLAKFHQSKAQTVAMFDTLAKPEDVVQAAELPAAAP
jgi:murein DD-endopeptidase MepM/ murein hydrolase activator NlpD